MRSAYTILVGKLTEDTIWKTYVYTEAHIKSYIKET